MGIQDVTNRYIKRSPTNTTEIRKSKAIQATLKDEETNTHKKHNTEEEHTPRENQQNDGINWKTEEVAQRLKRQGLIAKRDTGVRHTDKAGLNTAGRRHKRFPK